MATYSRSTPSPRYFELLAQFRQMHTEGDPAQQIPPERCLAGERLPTHAVSIKLLIDKHRARTLLDYGSGKGLQYGPMDVQLPDGTKFASIPAYWGVDTLDCYDPAHEPLTGVPQGQYDGVICTDVLEHCAEDDLHWIVGELFAHARAFVFANVACYPPTIRFADGLKERGTVRDLTWWQALIRQVAADHPQVRYHFLLNEHVRGSGGRLQLAFRPVVG